jgi:hypothetical protein
VTQAGRWSVAAALALLVAAPAAALGTATTQGPARNVAKSAGLAQVTQSIGSTIGDFNRDGRPDVLLNRAYKAPAGEYLNTGGHFRAVNLSTFVRDDRHGCAVADVNHDGRQDIYCAVGASHGVKIKSNELWMQKPDTTSSIRTGAAGGRSSSTPTRTAGPTCSSATTTRARTACQRQTGSI